MLNRFLLSLTGWYSFRTDIKDFPVFLNRLNESGVPFWGARADGGCGHVRVSLFHHSVTVSASEGIAEEEKRFGLPFIIYKYRRRAGLAVGTVIGLLIMFASSLFVWDVRVTGNAEISDARILKELSFLGVDVGTFIPSIYAPKAGTELLLSLPELSSAYVNINGTTVTADVIERRRKPESERKGSDEIVASEDGMIVKVEAYSGKPLVSHGDVVTKGQPLITGSYVYGAETEIRSEAKGCVYAEVKKTFVFTVPLSLPCREYTGRTDVKTSYNVLGKDFDFFYGPPTDYELFEAEIRSERKNLFFLSLPVTKTTLCLREYRTAFIKITPDEAGRRAEKAFLDRCAEIDGEIVSRDAKLVYDENAHAVTLVGRVTVICDIAEPSE